MGVKPGAYPALQRMPGGGKLFLMAEWQNLSPEVVQALAPFRKALQEQVPRLPPALEQVVAFQKALQELVPRLPPALERVSVFIRELQKALPPGEVFTLQAALPRRGAKRVAFIFRGLIRALILFGMRVRRTAQGRVLLRKALLAAACLLLALLSQKGREQEAEISPPRPAFKEEEPPPPKPIQIFLRKTLMPVAP